MQRAWWTRFQIPMPTLKFVLSIIVGLFAVYGVYLGLRQMPVDGAFYINAAYFFGVLTANTVKGILAAGIVWLLAWLIGRFRIKNPGRIVLRIGTVAYWVGCALAVYIFGLAIYTAIFAALASENSQRAISAVSPY